MKYVVWALAPPSHAVITGRDYGTEADGLTQEESDFGRSHPANPLI